MYAVFCLYMSHAIVMQSSWAIAQTTLLLYWLFINGYIAVGSGHPVVVVFACLQELIRRQQDIENAKRLYKGDGNEDMPTEI